MNQNIKELNDIAIKFMSSDRLDFRNAGWLLWMLLGICDRLITNATLLETGCLEDDRGWMIQSTVQDLEWLSEHTNF